MVLSIPTYIPEPLKFEDFSEPKSEIYSPDVFSKIYEALRINTDEDVISEFEKTPEVYMRVFKRILFEDPDMTQHLTFLHVACQFGRERIADWLISKNSSLTSLISYDSTLVMPLLTYMITKVSDDKNCIGIFIKVIAYQCQPKPKGSGSSSSESSSIESQLPLTEQVKQIIYNKYDNLILKAAFHGQRLIFESMLGFLCNKDENLIPLLNTCAHLPASLASIVSSYCPFFKTGEVQKAATLTSEVIGESEDLFGIDENLSRSTTPFEEVLRGLNKNAFEKDKIKSYIELARCILDFEEDASYFLVETIKLRQITIRDTLKSKFPDTFLERLKTTPLDTLTDEIYAFNLPRRISFFD